ncbi:MAG: hypothetical protein OEZ65_17055 [Gemmatimonadota bacterium]|nr:hypothetical protein [Gemmatimonadota bacterium]
MPDHDSHNSTPDLGGPAASDGDRVERRRALWVLVLLLLSLPALGFGTVWSVLYGPDWIIEVAVYLPPVLGVFVLGSAVWSWVSRLLNGKEE